MASHCFITPTRFVNTTVSQQNGKRNVRKSKKTDRDLVELLEAQRAVLVDGCSDVVAIGGLFDLLQLPDARHVGQLRLDLRHAQDLENKQRSGHF